MSIPIYELPFCPTPFELALLVDSVATWAQSSAKLRTAGLLYLFGAQRPPSALTHPPWVGPDADLGHELDLDAQALGGPATANGQGRAPARNGPPLTARFMRWLVEGAKMQDAVENVAIATVELATSVSALHYFKISPVWPLIFNPLLNLPWSRELDLVDMPWSRVLLSSVGLTLAREMQRVSVLVCVHEWRRITGEKARKAEGLDFGKILVRGGVLETGADVSEEDDGEEEDLECLICTGGGNEDMDDVLSQSISSLSDSPSPASPPSTLETFCSHSPKKHVYHRTCFLGWHSAYRQMHAPRWPFTATRTGGDMSVSVTLSNGQAASNADLKRVRTVLALAPGFEYLARMVRRGRTTQRPRQGQAQNQQGSTFELNVDPTSSILGTLKTSAPSCPACRSPVTFTFVHVPRSPRRRRPTSSSSPPSPMMDMLRSMGSLARLWGKTWADYVSGRSIVLRLATQVLFVGALISRARRPSRV